MLHEFERVALQKLAIQKLNSSSDLGVTVRIPKGETLPVFHANENEWGPDF